jgi:hypothetical protein
LFAQQTGGFLAFWVFNFPLFARLMLNICPTFRLCNLLGGGSCPPLPPVPYAYVGKTDRRLYTRTKEHSYRTESVIHQHLSTCQQFQHIKALFELYPDDDAKSNQTNIMAEHVFHNTKLIDKSNHWSFLLYQESLAIQRYNWT